MTGQGTDQIQEKLYDLGREIRSGSHFRLLHAKEKTLGAECFYHEYFGGDELSSRGRDRALAMLQRYANLTYPRTPRIADAWLRPDGLVVVEFKAKVTPIGVEKNNPLEGGNQMSRGALFEDTLALLAALHRAEVTHGSVRPECYGIGAMGRIFLDDIGLDNVIPSLLTQEDEDDFSLSHNVFGRDLAHWAFWMLSLAIGEPIYKEPESFWDDVDLKQIDTILPSISKNPDGTSFFRSCLLGFTAKGGPYESAWDALQAWRNAAMRKVFE